jgi:hypothetical protein
MSILIASDPDPELDPVPNVQIRIRPDSDPYPQHCDKYSVGVYVIFAFVQKLSVAVIEIH